MVTSRQKPSVVFAFGLFLLLSFAVGGTSFAVLLRDPDPFWAHYLSAFLLIPLATVILMRQFINYKVIHAGDGKLSVSYPIRRSRKTYKMEAIKSWRETSVKTGKQSTYTELEIIFDDQFKLVLGSQEYTAYTKVVQYLAAKAARRKIA